MAKILASLFMAKLVLVGIVNIGCLVLLFSLYCAEVCNVLAGPITNLQVIAPTQYISFGKNVAAVASRWRLCVQFDRYKMSTSNFPPSLETNSQKLKSISFQFKTGFI